MPRKVIRIMELRLSGESARCHLTLSVLLGRTGKVALLLPRSNGVSMKASGLRNGGEGEGRWGGYQIRTWIRNVRPGWGNPH